MAYPKDAADRGVPASPNLPDVEARVLAHWEADGTFAESINRRPAGGDGEFVFYDGPPFANGLPHYGHLLTGYVKDIIPRYQTMRGKRVDRRFGWDCHGLPAEVEAEKQLGISSRAEIEEMGVDKFNAATRESVLKYTRDWERYVTRQARWVDFENDYKTLDLDYMESVMWAFKSLWDKGLVYEGYRVLWYCMRCETPLSNTEIKMDDTYRDRQDPSVTVALPLTAPGSALDGVNALVWTTTPWTLPSNLAVAVHPAVEYVVVSGGDFDPTARFLLAADCLAGYARELGDDPEVLSRHRGSELLGLSYVPPFDFFVGAANAHQVLSADYVTTEDGTGLVHMAPAYGEDDKLVTDAAGIEPVTPVDSGGRFTEEVAPYAGQQIFEANKPIIRDLKAAGKLLRHDTYVHPYPHCWRCDTPLMQRALSSWFIEVTRFRERMVELNQGINWTPSHIRDGQFGKWLEGARDWNVSRNRFWGSPIPVWKSDDPQYPRVDVYGSLDELERDFGVRPDDLHRPAVDELTRPNPDDPTGKSTMRRVTEVLDCWFESGAMPFAQVHYPFENTEWFESHYPGDFIVEYHPQTRGWFYTLHVLATALFDRPAFSNCLVHGTLLGEDGRKMSKSLRNYPDVYEVFDSYGADAMRWYVTTSPVLRGGDMPVTESGIRDTVRQVILPLWNVWYFFSLYANAEDYDATPGGAWPGATSSDHVLDRYILAKTRRLVEDVQHAMDAYDVTGAGERVRFYLDALTNWYVRRSRDRFWSGDRRAFDTLSTVLRLLCEVSAPLLPLLTEEVWRGLTGGRSVHLADWPNASDLPSDDGLVAAMDTAREVCSAALSVRKTMKLRVRLPLASLTVATPDPDALRPFADLIADEVNVKHVEFVAGMDDYCDQTLSLAPKVLGPRLGAQVQHVIKAVKAGDWAASDDAVVAGGVVLEPGEYELALAPRAAERTAVLPAGKGVVVLDTDVTDALAAEGVARDVVRVVQQARKDAALEVTDKVTVQLDTDAQVESAVQAHRDFVAGETLAQSVEFGPVDSAARAGEVGDGTSLRVQVRPVD